MTVTMFILTIIIAISAVFTAYATRYTIPKKLNPKIVNPGVALVRAHTRSGSPPNANSFMGKPVSDLSTGELMIGVYTAIHTAAYNEGSDLKSLRYFLYPLVRSAGSTLTALFAIGVLNETFRQHEHGYPDGPSYGQYGHVKPHGQSPHSCLPGDKHAIAMVINEICVEPGDSSLGLDIEGYDITLGFKHKSCLINAVNRGVNAVSTRIASLIQIIR